MEEKELEKEDDNEYSLAIVVAMERLVEGYTNANEKTLQSVHKYLVIYTLTKSLVQ